MQVIAVDGTVIECDNYESRKKGLMLQEKHQGKKETIGFVPYDRMMYVIPEDTVHNVDELDELPA